MSKNTNFHQQKQDILKRKNNLKVLSNTMMSKLNGLLEEADNSDIYKDIKSYPTYFQSTKEPSELKLIIPKGKITLPKIGQMQTTNNTLLAKYGGGISDEFSVGLSGNKINKEKTVDDGGEKNASQITCGDRANAGVRDDSVFSRFDSGIKGKFGVFGSGEGINCIRDFTVDYINSRENVCGVINKPNKISFSNKTQETQTKDDTSNAANKTIGANKIDNNCSKRPTKSLGKIRVKGKSRVNEAFLTDVGLVKFKKEKEEEAKKKNIENDPIIKGINDQIEAILNNIDEDGGEQVNNQIKDLNESANFMQMIKDIDDYKNEIHEEFDEVKYLIKFANNTHKLIDRHKNVVTKIFKGAGLKPNLERSESKIDLKLRTERKLREKKANFEEESVCEFDDGSDEPRYENGYYKRTAKEDIEDLGEVFDRMKAINKVKDNLSNIQDDFLGYHNNLKVKIQELKSGKKASLNQNKK